MIPVYLYKCMVWSDGEDHPEEDHNSYYDFEYIILKKEPWNIYLLTIPEANVLCSHNPNELEDNEIIRVITLEDVLTLLKKYRPCKYSSMVEEFKKSIKPI